jgi:hypothetical protein
MAELQKLFQSDARVDGHGENRKRNKAAERNGVTPDGFALGGWTAGDCCPM